MPRSEQRSAALRFCVTALVSVACLFAWVALFSYNVADPPGNTVWPLNQPPANLCGPFGAWLAHYLLYYLGVGAYAAATLLAIAALAWGYGLRVSDRWLRFIGLLLICLCVSTLGTLYGGDSGRFPLPGPGGVLGSAAAPLFQSALKTTGTLILLACALLVGLLLAADEVVVRLARWLWWLMRRSSKAAVSGGQVAAAAGVAAGAQALSSSRKLIAATATSPTPDGEADEERHESARRGRSPVPLEEEPEERHEIPSERIAPRQLHLLSETREMDGSPAGQGPTPAPEPGDNGKARAAATSPSKDEKAEVVVNGALLKSEAARRPSAAAPRATPAQPDYVLPSIGLLELPPPVDRSAVELRCREKAYVLEQTLNEFRLDVRVVAIETGPVITVFELKLAPGIKVSQVASLTNDMARALKAPSVRVVAPLPNKNTVGIEVPNIDKEKVRVRDVMELAGRATADYAIPLFLGKDAAGQPLVNDLTRMPHLLIAGTTGSGKSVCVASIITSLLMTRSPEQVQMILVDPKVVELAIFKDVPHLMCPIVTEVSRAEAILDWAATKMDERYALLAEAGVKDIRSYNKLGAEALRERFQPADEEEFAQIPTTLPYIVVVIDELADLMMTSAKEVEFYLCRLAQKSRAVGIHLIVSTQRPQANVVTGLVKSNLPCRIAFRVSSRLDSRIVLDQNGGEVLMGQGDMLFLPPGSSKLVRAQGTFISDDELRTVVRHCRAQRQPQYHPELLRMPAAAAESDGERDELFDQAVDIVIESGRGSVSLLQRRLTVGYSRASRLIEQMYAAGIVGEYKGSQAREVVLSKDEWNALRTQRDAEEAAEFTESGA